MTDDFEKERVRLQEIIAPIASDPEDYQVWDSVINALHDFDGGINRNSSPVAISTIREVYDRLLARYPLYYGYWKKYADLEFSISGTEQAELIYERGIASVPVSYDLWALYCEFKAHTCHDPETVRELFERAAEACGLDWRSDVFWDKYIEFEERMDQPGNKWQIYYRATRIPLGSLMKYYEKLRQLAHTRPIEELVPREVLESFRKQVEMNRQFNRSEAEKEREIRVLIDSYLVDTCKAVYEEFSKRYTMEEAINPNYFTNADLDEKQLENWRAYLTFEEKQGDYKRIRHLYERCIIVCANYEEFWLRYIAWMSSAPLLRIKDNTSSGKDVSPLIATVSQSDLERRVREESIRHIFARASCIFLPIAKPRVRYLWARFEEAAWKGPDVAKDIFDAILAVTPSDLSAGDSLANLEKRHRGLDAAVQAYQGQIVANSSADHRGLVLSKAALMLFRSGQEDRGRKLFEDHIDAYNGVSSFWSGYLDFEISVASAKWNDEPARQRVKDLHMRIRGHRRLSPNVIDSISAKYMDWLMDGGGADAAEDYMKLYTQIHR